MDVAATEPVELPASTVKEPPMKRLKVGQVAMVHVDEVDFVNNNELDVSMFERDTTEYQTGGDEDGPHSVTLNEFNDELLSLPFSEEEPVLEAELLSNIWMHWQTGSKPNDVWR